MTLSSERDETLLFEVYVNGSPKFEGTWQECEAWAERRLEEGPAEINIDRVEDDG